MVSHFCLYGSMPATISMSAEKVYSYTQKYKNIIFPRPFLILMTKFNFMSVIWRNRIALSIPDLYPPCVMFTIIIKTRALVVETCREGIMIANILYL